MNHHCLYMNDYRVVEIDSTPKLSGPPIYIFSRGYIKLQSGIMHLASIIVVGSLVSHTRICSDYSVWLARLVVCTGIVNYTGTNTKPGCDSELHPII